MVPDSTRTPAQVPRLLRPAVSPGVTDRQADRAFLDISRPSRTSTKTRPERNPGPSLPHPHHYLDSVCLVFPFSTPRSSPLVHGLLKRRRGRGGGGSRR